MRITSIILSKRRKSLSIRLVSKAYTLLSIVTNGLKFNWV